MPRFRLDIEYDGSDFHGWQSQVGFVTVQDKLEEAIYRMTSERLRLQVCGRTDAGVHAVRQIAHLDLYKRPWRPEVLLQALNAHLLEMKCTGVCIIDVQAVADDFHARLQVAQRCYRYKILNRFPPSALERNRVWHIRKKLDVKAMHEAAQSWLGYHDFSSFRAAGCQARSPMRTLDKITVTCDNDYVLIDVCARSFLYKQVRSLVGTLVQIGRGDWPISQAATVLEARDRRACGPVAPPNGLYFLGASYLP